MVVHSKFWCNGMFVGRGLTIAGVRLTKNCTSTSPFSLLTSFSINTPSRLRAGEHNHSDKAVAELQRSEMLVELLLPRRKRIL